jgi:hypothetical protein
MPGGEPIDFGSVADSLNEGDLEMGSPEHHDEVEPQYSLDFMLRFKDDDLEHKYRYDMLPKR